MFDLIACVSQALDHATGYILAAAAIRGLTLRECARQSTPAAPLPSFAASTSLARVAELLLHAPRTALPRPAAPLHVASLARDADFEWAGGRECTAWGDALRLRPPLLVQGHPVAWGLPATTLGSAPAQW